MFSLDCGTMSMTCGILPCHLASAKRKNAAILRQCPTVYPHTLHCHEKRENRPIQVLETRSGFCAGYAWSGEAGELVMLHPAFESYRADLLRAARAAELPVSSPSPGI